MLFPLRKSFWLAMALGTVSVAGLAQRPSSGAPNPQDVPQQTPPGTNNPDISKQRRPGPTPPRTANPDQQSADVPQQQPGTNNPDVGKQRPADKSGPAPDSNTSKPLKKAHRHKKSKTTQS